MDHDHPKPMLQDPLSAKSLPSGVREEHKPGSGPSPREPANGSGTLASKNPSSPSVDTSDGHKLIRGEKQIKPNKVYIGGLPEHTRQEDLQNCFGKIGNIVTVELKLGYGFVEFDTRAAAEESVAKYHGGYFMGNKIRVELSHGGGRTAKYAGEPGACFKCGQQGHWARECPSSGGSGRPQDPADRPHNGSHYGSPPRDYSREDFDAPGGRYYPPPDRDPRYADVPPPPPHGRDYRDYRPSRPLTPPPRDYRDYPPARGPGAREYDDFRSRPVDQAVRYDRSYYPPPAEEVVGYREAPPSYSRPVYGAGRETYDRRAPPPPPPPERYPYSSPTSGARPRSPTPTGRPLRDEYERQPPPPPRDYLPSADYRGRVSPRYNNDDRTRFRRRSQSPPAPARPAGSYIDSGPGYQAPYAGQRPPARDEYRAADRNGRAQI